MAGTDFSWQEIGAAGPRACLDLSGPQAWAEDPKTLSLSGVPSVAETKALGQAGGLLSAKPDLPLLPPHTACRLCWFYCNFQLVAVNSIRLLITVYF